MHDLESRGERSLKWPELWAHVGLFAGIHDPLGLERVRLPVHNEGTDPPTCGPAFWVVACRARGLL